MAPRPMSFSTDLTFSVLLKQLRKRAGMTQGDLAAALGYSIALISSLEKAQRRPDLQAVTERFIPALGLQDDPHLAAALIEQAALARGERPPASMTFQRTTQMTWQEKRTVTSTHLPAPPTLLIGRSAEVTHLCNRLLGHSGRLLTLVGPPGVGKTTLALAVATQLQHYYRDGAYFVPLAATSDPLVMATTIIGVVAPGDTSAKPPESRLIELLRQRALLLVLDNLEQIAGAASLLATILAECPAVTILATSRERLHLRAEQRFKVPPLELPAAVELFVQRAQAAEAAFEPVPEQEAVIAAICQRLDCLPLALELCAARTDLLSPVQLLGQLQDSRLELLVAGSHDLPPRQHTLRTAIEHSYRLLSEDERILFRRLGVFIGGFDLAAASAVAGEDQENRTQRLLATLHALIGKSLVRSEPLPNGEQRLRLLETLRDYAYEQLASSGEHNEIHRRHARYFHELAVPPDEATTSKILNPKFANLPSQSTPFIGRSAELGQIAKLLVNPECRLITLLGPGGSGKTRLAIEVAQQQVNCYPQGVYFVSLAPIAAIEHAIPAMAEALQFRFQNDGRSPQVQLCDYLSNKQLLLILDNFEHLIEGATLVHEFLQSSPGLKCMVTSRERLQLHSETIFVVGSLSFPRDNSTRHVTEYAAIELFVKTARRVYSRFQLDDEHCQAVIQICQLVGGMPLGVILAASWVGIIAPTEIAAELVKGFQFLEVDLQDLPVRQRNMRVMLAYSWQRLTEVERETFMQLAIFRGGFTRAAAQTVSGASLPILARLIDKSFVQRIREDWYELHELLRQYGAEQLSLKPELERSARDRHSAYYCHLLKHQKKSSKKFSPSTGTRGNRSKSAKYSYCLAMGCGA